MLIQHAVCSVFYRHNLIPSLTPYEKGATKFVPFAERTWRRESSARRPSKEEEELGFDLGPLIPRAPDHHTALP